MRESHIEQPPEMNIVIGTKRKSKGGKRDGRHGRTGKVAVITNLVTGEEYRIVAPTRKALSRQIRKIAKTPPRVRFGEKETLY